MNILIKLKHSFIINDNDYFSLICFCNKATFIFVMIMLCYIHCIIICRYEYPYCKFYLFLCQLNFHCHSNSTLIVTNGCACLTYCVLPSTDQTEVITLQETSRYHQTIISSPDCMVF